MKYCFAIVLCLISLTLYSTPASLCDTICINELLRKSFLLERENLDSSFSLAAKAEVYARQIDYQKGLGQAYMRMGTVMHNYGRLDSALYYFEKVYKIRLGIKDYSGAAAACRKSSEVYNAKSMKDSAFSKIFQGLKLAELGRDSGVLIRLMLKLGDLYEEYQDMAAAKANYLTAEKIALRREDPVDISNVYGGLGNYYYRTNAFRKSLDYFKKQEGILRKTNDPTSLAISKANIALCYQELKDYMNAKIYYQQALNDYISLGLEDNIGILYFNFGNLYYENKLYDSAMIYLHKSLHIAKQNSNIEMVAMTYDKLSAIHASKGNFYEAYKLKDSFSRYQDSLLSTEKVKTISDMQTKYDIEKKQQEIALLNQQNKTKQAERNLFIIGTALFLLLALAVTLGLIKTRKAKKQSEDLLLNILPEEIAAELKIKGHADAQQFENVSVLFTDFVGFTQVSEALSPKELVAMLNHCFTKFDEIITKHNIEKIKTIGDSYMAAGGLPVMNPMSTYNTVAAAMEVQAFIIEYNNELIKNGRTPLKMRCGVHNGAVIAGIVGKKKYSYDIWGDTVNTASRMESSGEAGRVNISGTTYEIIKGQFECTYRGKIEAKNKGEIDMYFVEYELLEFSLQ
jgi:adenylate cyclase